MVVDGNGILRKINTDDILKGTVLIPTNTNGIYWNVFSDVDIKQIIIPQTVTYVYHGAFKNCKTLETVIFINNDCELGPDVFAGCENLKNVSLPAHISYVPFRTFYGCKKLTTISVPDTVERLSFDSFENCEKLKKISWRGKWYSYQDLMVYGEM